MKLFGHPVVRWAGAATGLAVTAWAIWQVCRPEPRLPTTVSVTSGQPAPPWHGVLSGPLHGAAHETAFETGLERLPHSLQGVDPPAGLRVDDQGRLVVTRLLRDFFDHFLSALGEESLPSLHARMRAYMARSLPPQAFREAVSILDGYLAYRQALQGVARAGGKPVEQLNLDAVAAQKQQERALRVQHLPAHVASAFFGEDDQHDQYTLARLRVARDPDLSEADKRVQLAGLAAQLPAATQASLRALQVLEDVTRIETLCRQQGCSPDQLRQHRAALVGDDAAARLQVLDVQRAAWADRVSAYLAQRATLHADPSLTEEDKQAQLQRLQQGNFTPEERLRLSAFELAHDGDVGR